MKLYSENKEYKLYQGNMLDMLEYIKPNSIDSIITDPPYGLTSMVKRFGKENSAPVKDTKGGAFARLDKGFMGKEWDGSGIEYNIETWEKCYEVLKPGGYLLAFGGSRTFHRIACAIEDAGFEIRDTIMWLYGSGFPKSLNIGLAIDKKNGVDNRTGNIVQGMASNNTESLNNHKYKTQNFKKEYEERVAQNDWNGWGTALKPSFEPIIVARKPFKGSLVDNVIEYGVGGINIDECRVGEIGGVKKVNIEPNSGSKNSGFGCNGKLEELNKGRFPANTILTYDEIPNDERLRYFYCAKASKKDRDEGLENFVATTDKAKGNGLDRVCEFCGVSQLTPELCHCETKSWITKPKKNTHPTVKPTELMQYLIRLVTPEGGVVLDPFNGSGSTGKAAMYENKERHKNYKYIGIELTEEYLPIAKARIEYVCNKVEESDNQMTIFDLMGE